MKKLMAVALVLCMVLSLGITAYADGTVTMTGTEIPGSKEFDATVIAQSNGELITADVVHDVTVEWTANGRVLYTLEHQYEWNSTKLAYEKIADGDKVTLDTNEFPLEYKIDVTNNSNVAVSYVLSFDDKTGDFKQVKATLKEVENAPDNVTEEKGTIPSVIGDLENYIVRDGKVILKSEPSSPKGESTSTDPNETCPYLPSGDSHNNRYYISFTENFTVGDLKDDITDLAAHLTSSGNIFKLGTFKITFNDVPTAAYFKDTLGYLLTENADNFPTTEEDAWENENGAKCWINDGVLQFCIDENKNMSFNLENDSHFMDYGNGTYGLANLDQGGEITITLSDDKFESIAASDFGVPYSEFNGTFKAPAAS